jgi:soluble lytic murein transglycosylase
MRVDWFCKQLLNQALTEHLMKLVKPTKIRKSANVFLHNLQNSASKLAIFAISSMIFYAPIAIAQASNIGAVYQNNTNNTPTQSPNDSVITQPTTEPTSVKVDFAAPAPVIIQVPENNNQALVWGLKAARSRDWNEVRRLMQYIDDNALRDAMWWRIVTDDASPVGFSENLDALNRLKGFPGMRDLRIRMEKSLINSNLNAREKIEFLSRKEAVINNNEPLSGEGMMSLASALLEIGDVNNAKKIASSAWRKYKLDQTLQDKYTQEFSSILSTEDFDQRISLLLWLDRTQQAKSLLPFASPNMAQTTNVRLEVKNDEATVLSGALLQDLGITYERVKRLRKADHDKEALDLLAATDWSQLPEVGQQDLWEERRRLFIEAIRSKRWQDAYIIVANHGLKSGANAAEGEQMAGWVALRFLNDPQRALNHYQNFDKIVQSAVSKARGYYWQGRCYEAMNNQNKANDFYQKAANYPTFYYGQMAAARLGQRMNRPAIMNLPPENLATNNDKARLENQPMMRIARAFSEIGERDLFVKFAFALDDVLSTNGEHQALSEFARARGENLVGIRVAKAGLNRGILATEAAFPIIEIPRVSGYHQAEDAFSLSITRQESEFNANARSKVGALGLMQFMPATAANQARKMELIHQTSWLTQKPQHNLMLGSAHLADLIDRFHGSYILTIIAYNAGPGRSVQWIDTYGEIRGGADPDYIIDWVEMIPFSETRNYVQRVLENMQVYRARLNGGSAPINIIEDISRGVKPPPVFKVNIVSAPEEPLLPRQEAPPEAIQ